MGPERDREDDHHLSCPARARSPACSPSNPWSPAQLDPKLARRPIRPLVQARFTGTRHLLVH